MSEPRDGWSKWDIVGKIATPVMIFIIGAWFTTQQHKLDASEKTAARIDGYVKSLYSESKPERSYAVAMLRRETRRDPGESVLEADIVPGLLIAAADADPLVADQARAILAEIAGKSDSAMKMTINRTLGTVDSSTQWVVVFSGRRTLDDARESERLLRADTSLVIRTYLRQGRFRSVAMFASQARAREKLQSIQRVFNDAYLVSLTGWCRDPMDVGTHVECVQPGR